MFPEFRIFRIESNGSRSLCGVAPSFAYADGLVQGIGHRQPGIYVIVDPQDRETIMTLTSTLVEMPKHDFRKSAGKQDR